MATKPKNVKPKKEVIVSEADLDSQVKKLSEDVVEEKSLDGLIIIAMKNGIFAPNVLARTVPDLLTLKFVLDREINRVIESTLNNSQN